MLRGMRPAPHLIAAILLCLASTAVQAAVVGRVVIVGLDDDMADNVRLSLSVVESIGNDVSERRMAYLVREAVDETREALEPFGYYSPQVTVDHDPDSGLVTISVVTGESRHTASRSRMRSGGPTKAISSANEAGTASIAPA